VATRRNQLVNQSMVFHFMAIKLCDSCYDLSIFHMAYLLSF